MQVVDATQTWLVVDTEELNILLQALSCYVGPYGGVSRLTAQEEERRAGMVKRASLMCEAIQNALYAMDTQEMQQQSEAIKATRRSLGLERLG